MDRSCRANSGTIRTIESGNDGGNDTILLVSAPATYTSSLGLGMFASTESFSSQLKKPKRAIKSIVENMV